MLLGKRKKGEVSELKLLYDMRYDVSVPEQVIAKWQYISAWQLLFPVKVVLKGNGSKGLWPQLVCCAPFLSIALYFRMLYISYPKIQMAIVVYPKVRTTIVWYPGREEGNVFLSEDKE